MAKQKRYRRPKVKAGEIKAQYGNDDEGYKDWVIYFGDDVPRCDRALIMNNLYGKNYSVLDGKSTPSLAEELESRGYDISTFKFSISKKD